MLVVLQMPKTKADKYKVGLEYIEQLSVDHKCRSFHSGPTGCKCISKNKHLIGAIKIFFKEEIKVFWEKPEHIAVCQKGEAIGHLFGLYLFPHCSLDSKRPGYVFTIKNKEVTFCINTITKIFGLGQHAETAARLLHVDQKAIGLNLLKKACWLDMKKNPDHRCLYRNYHSIFKHQIDPMSHNNPQAIQRIDIPGRSDN